MDYTIQENKDSTQFIQINPEDLNQFIAEFELGQIKQIDNSMNKSLNLVELVIANNADTEKPSEVTKFNFAVTDLEDSTPFSELQEELVRTNPFREFEDAPLTEEE